MCDVGDDDGDYYAAPPHPFCIVCDKVSAPRDRERDQINVADVYGRRVRVCREVVKPFDMDH